MKIPDVKGRNKIRDAKMIRMWISGEHTQTEIAKQFCITQARLGAILYKNADIIHFDAKHLKNNRLHIIERQIAKKKDAPSRKDIIDILDYQRKEVEGDKPQVDLSTNITKIEVNVVRNNGTELRDTPARQPAKGSRIHSTV